MSSKTFTILTVEQQAAEADKAKAVQDVVDALGDLDGPARVDALEIYLTQIPININGEQAGKLLGRLTKFALGNGIKILGPKIMPDLPAESAAKLLKDLSGKERLDALNALYRR